MKNRKKLKIFVKKIQNYSGRVLRKKTNNTEKQPINELYNYFKKYNENTGTNIENIATPHVPTIVDSTTLNDKITKAEIFQAVRKLKNEKSPRIDFVINEYI